MRNRKISADISEEAKLMLDNACKRHTRSKGFLLEKMIRKFCGDEVVVTTAPTVADIATVEIKPKAKRKIFKPPTVDEVREYCDSRCNDVDPQKFISHYTANGWVRGKAETKIKCWRSCVQTWEGNNKTTAKESENLGGNW